MKEIPCPCGLANAYSLCCGTYIEGRANAPTPECLMRSRYSAFVLANLDYLMATMAKEAAADFNPDHTRAWLENVTWDRLNVLQHSIKTPTLGFVSFEAWYYHQGALQVICEKSEFHKIHDQWFYVRGKPLNPHRTKRT